MSQQPRVVVGVDASPDARRALVQAAALTRALGGRLEVVLVYQTPAPMPLAYGLEAPSPAHARSIALDQLAESLEALTDADRALLAATEVLEGPAARTLVRRAAGADLLVVGSRGEHGALRGVLMGSVADHCVRHAPCPVLVVRPPGGSEPERSRSLTTQA